MTMNKHDEPSFSDDQLENAARVKLLRALSRNQKNPALAEMANEMLSGRLSQQSAMNSAAYSEAMGPATGEFLSRYSTLSETGKEELAAHGDEALRKLASLDLSGGSKVNDSPRRAGFDEDDELDFSQFNWARE